MTNPQVPLHIVDRNLKCKKCNHKGAVKGYGVWNPNGQDDERDLSHKQAFMDPYVGFAGTIPWECTNCSNHGLEYPLEGYDATFVRIGKEDSQ